MTKYEGMPMCLANKLLKKTRTKLRNAELYKDEKKIKEYIKTIQTLEKKLCHKTIKYY